MKRPYIFTFQIPRKDLVNLDEIDPAFIAEAESMEDAAELLGGELLWKKTFENAFDEKDIISTVGVISIPRERFNTPPTEEDYERGYAETGDLVHDTLKGFRWAINPEREKSEIAIIEIPLVTLS